MAAVSLLVACGGNKVAENALTDQQERELLTDAQGIFKVLPTTAENPENPQSPAKVALGKMLYYDTRLSLTGKNSCNSCHNLATYGVDNKATSTGDAGKNGGRNSPTTLNAALHMAQFWDGRAKDVEEQAGGPILNPIEMAIPSKEFMEKRLKDITEYVTAFKAAFPDSKEPVSYDNLQKAIGSFERTLLTPSRFDKYLTGDMAALNADEKVGLKKFLELGCTSCHSGALLGGTMYQKFGLLNDYHALTGSSTSDEGRKAITKSEADKDMFKVPSLRNITKTAPYFHDGSVADLSKAIQIMGKAQLNKDISAEDAASVAKFLESLTGEVPAIAKQ